MRPSYSLPLWVLSLLAVAALGPRARGAEAPKKLLVVTVSTGYRHDSIPVAEKVLAQLAAANGRFAVDFVAQPPGMPATPRRPQLTPGPDADARYEADLKTYAAAFSAYQQAKSDWLPHAAEALQALSVANLERYDGVVFASTTGELPLPDRQGFLDWVRRGHAFIGLHAATDTFHGFPGYVQMIGAEFRTHGAQVAVECRNDDPAHPATAGLPARWTVYDEIYQFKNFDRTAVRVLLSLDRHPNSQAPGFYPLAWCKRYGEGRVFYTALGHREDVWEETGVDHRLNPPAVAQAYQHHVLGGILWALGLAAGDSQPQVAAASAAPDRDWPEYLGGPERNHYSPIGQITTANVGGLRPAWEYHSGDFGQVQCSPLVVGHRLFGLTAANDVFALDAATGQPAWRYRASENRADHTVRGLTYWKDGADERILFTVDAWLCALDAQTGTPIQEFGTAGRVSLKTGLGDSAQKKWVVSTTPGTLCGDLLIMPLRVSEDQDAAPGFIQAFNVRTGRLAWTFQTIPPPGKEGYDTWPPDAYRNVDVGAANCWPGMAVDRARGIVYAPTGSASPDFWGGSRLGQDLFADCLLALDAQSGRLLWHYQFVHHDLWDRDPPSPPVLATLRRGGRAVDAVIQVTKQGFIFVFDRVTGEPLFPIEEKPVPPSDLPGEKAWPTQPVPSAPAPFARQEVAPGDISPYAENRTALLAILQSARRDKFQPFGTEPTLLFPGFDGGAEWGGPAVAPDGVMYVNANEVAWLASLSPALPNDQTARYSPGRRVYASYCIACHGPERLGLPKSGFPSLIGVESRRTRAEIETLLTTGKGMMPGFPSLSVRQKTALIDYVLGTEREGAPPAAAADGPPETPRIPWRFNGYNKLLDDRGYPAIPPPWGTLSAVDLNTGDYLWREPLGEFPDLSARGIPATGCENYGGPLVTAGGVLFIAATKDGMIRGFDRKNGELLWSARLPAGGFATPATYVVNGRQFIVVACGGAKLETPAGDSYVAFSLPPRE